MNIVTRKLIAKELYIYRWLTPAAFSGVASVLIATLGKAGFNVGSLTGSRPSSLWGDAGASRIMNERKEQSLQFVLSLPLSISNTCAPRCRPVRRFPDHVVDQLHGRCCWCSSRTACRTASPPTSPCFVYSCWESAVVLRRPARPVEAMTSAVIIVTNMGVSIFMFTVGPQPGIAEHMWAAHPVWNSTF
jgi:hypothetical protein